LAALLAVTPMVAQTGAREGARKKMDIDISEVKLPDAAFWATTNHDPGQDPIPDKYKTSHFGVVIDGPATVAINERETLPVFAYYMGSYQQVATHNFPHAAHIVAVDPINNRLFTAPFVQKRGETILSPERTPASHLPKGYLMTFQQFDAKERLELPWKPGRLITQVILFDLVSNRIETKLAAGADSFVDPALPSQPRVSRFWKGASRYRLMAPGAYPCAPRSR
jgi:hypothetical protein